METLATAGSVVSFVAIAGQLVQSTKALYEFWSSVKNVPVRLQWLSEDLRCLNKFLEHIRQQCARDPIATGADPGCQALQRCAIYTTNLEALIAPFRSQDGDHAKRRVWKSVKAEFSAKKIKSYRENLEAAKVNLILAVTFMNRFVVEQVIYIR